MYDALEKYICRHIDAAEPALAQLDRDTHVYHLRPRMVSGHLQGRILKMICRMVQPRRVLELGTFTGYSALCFAEGMAEDGEVHTLEIDDEVEDFAKEQGIEAPSLVGHSFGGRISIIFASRNKATRVVLVDAAGIKPKRPFKYYYKVYTFKFLKWLCNTFLPKNKAAAIIEKRRRGAGSADYNNASPKMRAILSKVVNEDLTPLLCKIKAPTLLFWGNLDTATPLDDAKKMERLIPDAGLVIAHGTGHFSFLENQGLFTQVMKNFFKIK